MKGALVMALLSAGVALAAVACGGGQSEQQASSPTPVAVPTQETPQAAGHGPPVITSRELPNDHTGGTRWAEDSGGGATWRIPTDDKEWEVAFQGAYQPFSGVPILRVTHLTTGQARVYSLSTVYNLAAGQLLLCSDRSGVLDQPGNQGTPIKCSQQSLTPEEQAVFSHVVVTGSYETHPPPPYPVPTQPGMEVPILLPTASPQASPPSVTVTPTPSGTPTVEVGQ